MINLKSNQGDNRDDNITLCELIELDSHENVEKSINTVIPTNIVHVAIKEEGIAKKSSEETINRFGIHSATGHTGQWTIPRKCNYPSDNGKNSLNHSRGVEGCEVSSYQGQHAGQWTIPRKCTYPSDDGENACNRLGGVESCEVSSHEGQHTGQWTFPCRYPSDYCKKSLNRLESVGECKVSLYEGKGGYLQWTRKADNHEVQSDKSEKSLICCDAMERNLHSVNVEGYIQRKDQLDKRDSEKLINHKHQIQCDQSVDKKLKPTLTTLCEVQC